MINSDMTQVENKPKATVKNLQFVEYIDRLIDLTEENEKMEDGQEWGQQSQTGRRRKHRSSYDLVSFRYRYIGRYDWFDTLFEENGKFGLKDLKGEVIVPAKYDGFPERYHFIYTHDVPRVALLHGKACLVKADGSGEELTPLDYDAISYMIILPYFQVKKGDKLGIIGTDGRVVVPCILDQIFTPMGNCVVFKADGKYGILDSSWDNLYVEPQFDNIEYIDMEQPYTVTKDGVEGVINEKGEFLTDEESLDYDGYLIGEYNPDF